MQKGSGIRVSTWFVCAALMSGIFSATTPAQPFTRPPAGGDFIDFPVRDAAGASHELRGMLWTPKGPAKGAVVLIHGGDGWIDEREGYYGRLLSAAGYAVLAVDSYGARGVIDTVKDQSRVPTIDMTRDALGARRYLMQHDYPAGKIAVMGTSKGGTASLYAADRNFLSTEADRFPAAIAFYPSCAIRPRSPRPASALFMALGEKDDWTGVKPCQELADSYAKAGGRAMVKVYADALQGFDVDPGHYSYHRLPMAENYSQCTVWVEGDGKLSFADKRFAALNDPELFAQLRASCVTKGASVGPNPDQRKAVASDLIEFLDGTIGK